MSEATQYTRVQGLQKILAFHWALFILLCAVCFIGFIMLYAVGDGNFSQYARPQIIRFGVGVIAMFIIAFTPINLWRLASPLAYLFGLLLLIYVEVAGFVGMGAQRWIDLGFMKLQPSELMKIAVVMTVAAYYSIIDPERVSNPLFLIPPILLIAVPMALVLIQPDLGTALLLGIGGATVMFLAGVSLWYFAAGIGLVGGVVYTVMLSRGTSWQLLKDYQFRRIETFLDPSVDPQGAGYHITQSKIALGSGGLTGRGFMQGSQSRLDFLPEKHTDFIFTSYAEFFGFVGSISLLVLYSLIIIFAMVSMVGNRDRFSSLLTGGLTMTFFLFFTVNMAMVMGLAPVVGVPLPFVSYGGSAMIVLLAAFGLIQSAHIHRPRGEL